MKQRLTASFVPCLALALFAVGCGRLGYEAAELSQTDGGTGMDAQTASPDASSREGDASLADGSATSESDGSSAGADDGGGDQPDASCTLGTVDNCGVCGRSCEASGLSNVGALACEAGECVVASCAAGFEDCDAVVANGCETPVTTLTDCGGCGLPCIRSNAVASCSTGTCAVVSCEAGFGDCDLESPVPNGCETPLDTLSDCGMCGMTCTGLGMRSCSGGSCTASGCETGFADCDMDNVSCETDLATLANCGACGRTCGTGGRLTNASATCANRRCEIAACDGGFADCDADPMTGCEVSLDDSNHCGRCNNRCSATEECSGQACTPIYTFTPTNFDPGVLPATAPTARFDCERTVFDSSDGTFSGGCGQNLEPRLVNGLMVIPTGDLIVTSSATLELVGNVPVVFAVFGDATIEGTLTASGSTSTAGAGGDSGACNDNDGFGGNGRSILIGGGGGGGGYGGSGGRGGAGTIAAGGSGGRSWGAATLEPLRGGCRGGSGGGCSSSRGGRGGGAVQIAATNRIVVSGRIRANGGDGPRGCIAGGGGGGGGSGGAILLEASFVTIGSAGRLVADGGDGGEAFSLLGSTGRGGSGDSPDGSNGTAGVGGGTAAGGGAGRIRVNASACTLEGSLSPTPSLNCN